jgi:SNF2 family DNA or RNA helicase
MDDRYEKGRLVARLDPKSIGTERPNIRLKVEQGDWQIDTVGPALQHLTTATRPTRDGSGEVTVPRTWAMVTQLAQLMLERNCVWAPQPDLNEWIFEEFVRRHSEGNDLKFDYSGFPEDRKPMPHQLGGAYLGNMNERFYFGDDAGTGKTMTALLTLGEMEAQGKNPFPAFVVAPASVVDPWLEELEYLLPDWPVTAYRGAKRKGLSTRYKIYVMSWDTFRLDMAHEDHELPPLLKFLVPRTVVFDEAHALCNKSKQSTAAMAMARVAEYVFPMSGTPIIGNVGGFYHPLKVLDIRSFTNDKAYRARYTEQISKQYGRDEIEGLTVTRRGEFYTLLQGSLRHVAKADVLKDLPPKRYLTRAVDIPPAYRAAYDEMQQDMIAHMPHDGKPLPVMNTLAQLQRLTQLATSACDVEIVMEIDKNKESETYGELVPHYKVTMREPSWKVDELMVVMKEMGGQPLLTFSPHTQLMKLAGARAEREGYSVGYIIGGQSHTARTTVRKAFQKGDIQLLCSNTKAGGVGLTLTRSDTVTFLEREWGFWRGSQNEDRLHRFGQLKEVQVIDIVARNTVESRVRECLKNKAQQLSDLVRDPRIVNELLGGQPLRV